MRLKRRLEDRHGIAKETPPAQQRRQQHGRSHTAGKNDFDKGQESKNQGHGHPREERRSGRSEA